MRLQKLQEGRRGAEARGELDFSRAVLSANADDVAFIGEHIGDAARDGRCRIEPDDRPRR